MYIVHSVYNPVTGNLWGLLRCFFFISALLRYLIWPGLKDQAVFHGCHLSPASSRPKSIQKGYRKGRLLYFIIDGVAGLRRLTDITVVHTLQRHNTENSKQIYPEKELRGLSPNFHIHVSVSDLYISTIGLPILLHENMWTDPGNI
jgi:hypothetical protein